MARPAAALPAWWEGIGSGCVASSAGAAGLSGEGEGVKSRAERSGQPVALARAALWPGLWESEPAGQGLTRPVSG